MSAIANPLVGGELGFALGMQPDVAAFPGATVCPRLPAHGAFLRSGLEPDAGIDPITGLERAALRRSDRGMGGAKVATEHLLCFLG